MSCATLIRLSWLTPICARSGTYWRSRSLRTRSTMNCSEISCETRAPSFCLDQVQHQVQRRDAAGAGEAVAVDAEELVAQLDARKFLAQRREVLPVDGGAVVIQQPRLGERIAAGAQRAQGHAPLGQALQGREHLAARPRPARRRRRTRTGCRPLPTCSSAMRGRELQPVAGRGRLPSRLTIDQSYTVCPVMMFAMRSGSTAFDSAIIE